MGFIPYFAAAIVVPAWPSVVCVILVKSAVELWTRRAPIKAILNISSHAVTELVVVSIYLLLGGCKLHSISQIHDLTHVTCVAGLPALVAFLLAHLSNNLIVTVAIAMSSDRPLKSVLQENHRATLGLDFLVVPWCLFSRGSMQHSARSRPRPVGYRLLGLRQFQQIEPGA